MDMSLASLIKGTGSSGFGSGSTAEEVTEGLDLSARTYLLTGCNSGIGLETLRVLTLRGAHVIAAARTLEKAEKALESVQGQGTPVACELSEPGSVRACIDEVVGTGRRLDAIICNAGVMALPKLEQQHGLELQFLTNHVGHFILVTGLLERLTEAGRVVMVSSYGHNGAPRQGIEFDNLSGEHGYSAWKAYGQAKLANILFATQLARRFEATGRIANALHPGVIKTNLARHMSPLLNVGYALAGPLFLKTVAQGAATQCYVATHSDLADVSGQYFADCNVARTSSKARDAALAERLWTVSEELVEAL